MWKKRSCKECMCCKLLLWQDCVACVDSHSFVWRPSSSLRAVNAIRNPSHAGGMEWRSKMVSGFKSAHRIQTMGMRRRRGFNQRGIQTALLLCVDHRLQEAEKLHIFFFFFYWRMLRTVNMKITWQDDSVCHHHTDHCSLSKLNPVFFSWSAHCYSAISWGMSLSHTRKRNFSSDVKDVFDWNSSIESFTVGCDDRSVDLCVCDVYLWTLL